MRLPGVIEPGPSYASTHRAVYPLSRIGLQGGDVTSFQGRSEQSRWQDMTPCEASSNRTSLGSA